MEVRDNLAGNRTDLDARLRDLLKTTNVYFQPPASIKLKYPCIIYNLTAIPALYADNRVYKTHRRYQVTYVTSDPDDAFIDTMLESFEMVSFDRHFTSDRLNHYIFTLYY